MAHSTAHYIVMANELLRQLNITKTIRSLEEIGGNIFVPLFEALCGENLAPIIHSPKSKAEEAHNLHVIIRSLSEDILQVSLSHISVEDILAGDRIAITNLLEIFQGLMEYLVNTMSDEENDGDNGDRTEEATPEWRGPPRIRQLSLPRMNGMTRSASDPAMSPPGGDRLATASSLERMVDQSLRMSQGTLDRSRAVASDLGSRMGGSLDQLDRRSPTRGPTGERTKADDEYDKLRIHVRRVEREASRVGQLAHIVADEALRKEHSQRDREAYLRRQLARYLATTGGALPGGEMVNGAAEEPDPRGQDWFRERERLRAEAVGVNRGRPRQGDVNQGREGEGDEEDQLADYVREHKDRVEELRQAAEAAARRVTFTDARKRRRRQQAGRRRAGVGSGSAGRREPDSSGDSLEQDRLGSSVRTEDSRNTVEWEGTDKRASYNFSKDSLDPERHRLAVGSQWTDTKKELLGEAYRQQFEGVASDEAEKLHRRRRRVQAKENALRYIAQPGGALGVVPKPSPPRSTGGLVRPIVKVTGPNPARPHMVNRLAELDAEGNELGERSRRILGDNPDDDELLAFLLEEFPFLQLSPATIRELWDKAARQASHLTQAERDLRKRKSKEALVIEEAERRQRILSEILHKELAHQQRLREQREQESARRAVKAKEREKKLQSVRARQYYDNFALQMRSKMLKKRTREEQIFRRLFREALNLQRERLRDMRRYAKEVHTKQAEEQRDDMESMENYYRDRFAMLAESLLKERKELELQEKAQGSMLKGMKEDLRKKMESDIRLVQSSLVRSDDDAYFRQLDADRALYELLKADYKP